MIAPSYRVADVVAREVLKLAPGWRYVTDVRDLRDYDHGTRVYVIHGTMTEDKMTALHAAYARGYEVISA